MAMTMPEPGRPGPHLRRLAAAMGIDTRYCDIAGETHHIGAEPLSALLAGLGRPAADEAEAERTLAALERARAARALEPVRVVAADGAALVTEARFAAEAGDRAFTWRLDLEEGGVRTGGAEAVGASAVPVEGPGGVRLLAAPLDLGADLPPGYHRLSVSGPATDGREGLEQTLIVAPRRCYQPPAWEDGRRAWGLAVEPYALRSARDGGVGDFTAVADLARAAASLGAGAVGLTPLHALFPSRPGHDSPYYASNRAFLNALFIDVEAVPDMAETPAAAERLAEPEFMEALDAFGRRELVDYAGVARLKLGLLRVLFDGFRERHLGTPAGERGGAFRDFVERGGPALLAHATFDALSEARGPNWRVWPADCRRPDGAGVAAFRAAHAEAVDFFLYLQWEADRQLSVAAQAGEEAGLAIGLYLDIAVGAAPDGAEAWIHQDSLVFDAQIGSPPDAFNPKGQTWGLPPFDPHALRRAAYAPFIELLRANMRHAGAVRIDHVMGLTRQFWVPNGRTAADGAYVRFPLDDLLGILALESWRNRCAVVGEDLGTVPEGFRGRMNEAGVLSYRLLYFERGEGGRFIAPSDYPALSLATVATHDLPPLPAYWTGHDIELRARLGLFPGADDAEAARDERAEARAALTAALRAHGGLSGDDAPPIEDIVLAAYRFLARSRSCLLMVQLEDVLGLVEQANLPGTTDQHPNWKRRLPLTVQAIAAEPRVRRLAEMLAAEGRGPTSRT